MRQRNLLSSDAKLLEKLDRVESEEVRMEKPELDFQLTDSAMAELINEKFAYVEDTTDGLTSIKAESKTLDLLISEVLT